MSEQKPLEEDGWRGAPPVGRARPGAYFHDADWTRLRRISSWRGLALVAHCWAVIGLALAAGYAFPNPLVWLICVMVVGARQLGLAILMHESAHGLTHPDRRVNDAVGQWLCATPIGVDLAQYRDYHLSHHKYTQTESDPDLGLAAPFPVTTESLRRKIIRDLTGQTFVKQRFALFASAGRHVRGRQAAVVGGEGDAPPPVLPFAVFNLALFALLTALGAPLAFLIWLVAMATWFPLATRIRNIAEHACVRSEADAPFTHARTTRANWPERIFIAPYWVNFHAEHHLFMYLPCYRLAEARALLSKARAPKTPTAQSYRHVLRVCTQTTAQAI